MVAMTSSVNAGSPGNRLVVAGSFTCDRYKRPSRLRAAWPPPPAVGPPTPAAPPRSPPPTPPIPTADFRIRSRRSTGVTLAPSGWPARTLTLRHQIGGVCLWPDAVVEDEEWEPEDPEGVLSPELPVLHVHVELLVEATNRERGEVPRLGVDDGEVVARMVEVAAARQHQPTTGPGPGGKGGGEVRLW